MSLEETLTAVRENIPAVAVVFNNGQWGAEKKNQIDFYADRYLGTNLENPSFAGIAEAMGAAASRSTVRTRSATRCATPSPAAGRPCSS